MRHPSGLQLVVAPEHTQPVLRVIRPGQPDTDRSIHVLFPEHVTGVREGRTTAEHLYMFRPGTQEPRPTWRRAANRLEYRRALPGPVRLLARATLEEDGVRFSYVLQNDSTAAYRMISPVTDPRLTGDVYDVRLTRTYVHHADGFDLLGSEVPDRLTLPLRDWLPARVLASFAWPVPAERFTKGPDGISHYQKARAVDVPFIATVSSDGGWVVASVARESGNVWSNPELTCQHVDPQTSLAPGEQRTLEVKLLVMRGTVNDALARALAQRGTLP